MKVKVVKCDSKLSWYYDRVGEIFDVIPNIECFHYYRVRNYEKYLTKEDIKNEITGLFIKDEDLGELTETDSLFLELQKAYKRNKILLERLHQCKKSHRENKDKLMGKIYKILRRNK